MSDDRMHFMPYQSITFKTEVWTQDMNLHFTTREGLQEYVERDCRL